jgi:hypothetical protein
MFKGDLLNQTQAWYVMAILSVIGGLQRQPIRIHTTSFLIPAFAAEHLNE